MVFFSYHGGKQKIAKKIVDLLPKHKKYCEPFFGGGAVLFNKPKADIEIVNDTYKPLTAFYRCMQDTEKRSKLIERLSYTPFSEIEHKLATKILKSDIMDNEIELAWAFFVSSQQGFGKVIYRGFALSKHLNNRDNNKNAYFNKINRLEEVAKRFIGCIVRDRDALEIIRYYDAEDMLFYLDPPYINTDCGHYGAYTIDNYKALLELLKTLKGTFILSGYPNDYADACDFHIQDIEKLVTVNVKTNNKKITERLWSNKPFLQQGKLLEVF